VPKPESRHFDFRQGLGTTKPEQSGSALPFEDFYDAIATNGALTRRKGMVRVARITPSAGPYCGDFDATNDVVTVLHDSRVWDLDGIAAWTLEILCSTDTLSSQRPIFARSSATPDINIYADSTSGGRVVADLLDSANATTTLQVTGIAATTLCAIQLIKHDADSFTLRVNGSSSTGTLASGALKDLSSSLLIGKDFSSNFYDGKIDFVRLLSIVRADQRDGWCRLHNPQARYVLADYNIEQDANDYILDRSPYGNHAIETGGLATSTASLAVHPVTIQAIAPVKTSGNARKVVVMAGGRMFGSTVR
jgi:hypothetical protein